MGFTYFYISIKSDILYALLMINTYSPFKTKKKILEKSINTI